MQSLDRNEINVRLPCHHALLAHRAYVSKEAARLAANEALDIVEALHSEQVFTQVANQAGQLMKSNDLL